MAKRKAISKKIRFEVFKRDSFKCQFCGATSPNVLLVIDHLQPVSKGGGNDITNLVTSCEPCNAGKSNREISDDSILAKQREQLEALSERREQLGLMMRWRKGLKALTADSVDAVAAAFIELIDGYGTINDTGRREIQKWLKKFSLPQLLDAVEACASYLEKDGDKYSSESILKAFEKIPRIARCATEPEEKQQLYYIRGIMRNRYSYINEWRAMQMMVEAFDGGVEVEEIKGLVLETTSWTQFVDGIDQLVRIAKSKGGAT